MVKNYLITQSLHNSISWLETCPQSWRTKAYNDLKATLGRAPWVTPDAKIQRGIDFENKVYDVAAGIPRGVDSIDEQTALNWFVNQIKGAKIQNTGKKIVEIDGLLYCLFVKTDAHHIGEKIDDIKTTGSYKKDKYVNTFQNPLYCYVMNEKKFRYLIQPFIYNEYAPEEFVWCQPVIEEWEVPETQFGKPFNLEAYIYNEVRHIRQFLTHYPELDELYQNVYSR